MRKSFLVIGLGRFGTSLSKTLCQLGHQVMAVDIHPDNVADVVDSVTHAIQADTTEERVIDQLGVSNFDCVIISVGDDIRSSILTTVLCKERGAKQIIAKASDDLHAKLLHKTGADKVIQPEREGGVRLARSLVSENIVDYLDLSDAYSINETHLPPSWVGKSLVQLNVRANYNVSVIAIRRNNEILVTFDPQAPMQSGDILVLIGDNSGLSRIAGLR